MFDVVTLHIFFCFILGLLTYCAPTHFILNQDFKSEGTYVSEALGSGSGSFNQNPGKE